MLLPILLVDLALLLSAHAFALIAPDRVEQRNSAATQTCTLASPSPSNCGMTGYHKTNSVYKNYGPVFSRATKQLTVEDCAYSCARRAYNAENLQSQAPSGSLSLWCASFTYEPESNTCQLFNIPNYGLLLADKPNPNGTQKPQAFYSVDCYDCGDLFCATAAGQPLGTNLLNNAEFQGYTLGPWGAGYSNSLKRVRNGSESYLSWSDSGYLRQGFNMCPGQWYELSYDYKYDPGTGEMPDFDEPIIPLATQLAYPYVGQPFSWGLSRDPSADTNGAWQHHRILLYKTPQMDHTNLIPNPIGVSLFDAAGSDGGTFAVRNFFATRRTVPPEPAAGATSAIKNGGFETGFSPWKFYSVRTNDPSQKTRITPNMTSPGLDGSQHALLIRWHVYSYYFLIQDNVVTKPNTLYRMSADFYNDFGSDELQYYGNQIQFFAVSNGVVQKQTFGDFGGEFNPINNVTLSWIFYSVGNTTTIAMDMGTDEESGNLTIDNIRLVEVAG